MMDITSTFDFFIDMFVSGFRTCYSLLDRITFHDISLLDFMLWVLALSIILPLLLTLLGANDRPNGDYFEKYNPSRYAQDKSKESITGKKYISSSSK